MREASGGSASQNASAPSAIPTIPIVCGCVQRMPPSVRRSRSCRASAAATPTTPPRLSPTKRMTRPWMIVVRLPARSGRKIVGSSCRLEVPLISAPKSSDATPTPTAVLRPSSAAARPMNPIWLTWMSVWPIRYSQPVMSSAPARPAKRAGDRHREEVVPGDRDAAVARRLRVEPDRANLEAERRPVDDDPVDDEHRDRDEDPDREPLQQLEPQKTGSFAPSAMSFEIGIDAWASSAAGRPARTGTRRPRSRSS